MVSQNYKPVILIIRNAKTPYLQGINHINLVGDFYENVVLEFNPIEKHRSGCKSIYRFSLGLYFTVFGYTVKSAKTN